MTDDQTPTDRDPLDESDKRDRYDRDGDRWVWREECAAWCEDFTPRPANTSPQAARDDLPASQPEPDQLDTPNLDKPSKALPPEIDAALTRALADAWDEGYCARHADDAHATYTDNPYRQEQP